MSITDELRECIATAVWQYENDVKTAYIPKDKLTAIADRIDEQRENDAIGEYTRGYNAGFNAASAEVESADELRERMEREYVKLPVDADGEIWTGNERVFEVDSGTRYDMRYLMYDGEKWIIDSSFGGFIANGCRHVKPDSWERIIQDALTVGWQNGNWNEVASAETHDRLVERCKRLAGE